MSQSVDVEYEDWLESIKPDPCDLPVGNPMKSCTFDGINTIKCVVNGYMRGQRTPCNIYLPNNSFIELDLLDGWKYPVDCPIVRFPMDQGFVKIEFTYVDTYEWMELFPELYRECGNINLCNQSITDESLRKYCDFFIEYDFVGDLDLNLSYNKLTDVGIEMLVSYLTRIDDIDVIYLNLVGNNLTSRSLIHLRRLQNLCLNID